MLLVYSSLYLLGISAFQLFYNPAVDFEGILSGLLSGIPDFIKSSSEIRGFYKIKGKLWESLIWKLLFVLISTYVWRYL